MPELTWISRLYLKEKGKKEVQGRRKERRSKGHQTSNPTPYTAEDAKFRHGSNMVASKARRFRPERGILLELVPTHPDLTNPVIRNIEQEGYAGLAPATQTFRRTPKPASEAGEVALRPWAGYCYLCVFLVSVFLRCNFPLMSPSLRELLILDRQNRTWWTQAGFTRPRFCFGTPFGGCGGMSGLC